MESLQQVLVPSLPRCPDCGADYRWSHAEGSLYFCECGGTNGRLNTYAALAPHDAHGLLQCPRGHGWMHRQEQPQPFWLCAVCGLGAYEDGGPVRVQELGEQEVLEARRKAVEVAVGMAGYMRSHRADIEAWIAQGGKSGGLSIFGGATGQPSNPTMNRTFRIVSDPRIALIGTRCKQIDAIWNRGLDPLLQEFASIMYFTRPPSPPRERVCAAMRGISEQTYYRFRADVLDAYASSLPAGWSNPEAWWGVSPAEAVSIDLRQSVRAMRAEAGVES